MCIDRRSAGLAQALICCQDMRFSWSIIFAKHGPLAVCTALLVSVLSVSAAFADCTDFAGNQVLNCSFEAGDPPVDWAAVYGQEFQQETPGLEGLTSASLVPESTPPFGYWAIVMRSECFPLTEDAIYRYGAHFRRSISVGYCRVHIDGFEDGNCNGTYYSIGAPALDLVADEWLHVESQGVPYGGRSGRLALSCVTSDPGGGPAGPEILIDGAYAIPLADLNEIPDMGALGRLVFALLLGVVGVATLTRR